MIPDAVTGTLGSVMAGIARGWGWHMDDQLGRLTPTASLADVVDEVYAAVRVRTPRHRVVMTVRRCRRELDILHGSAHPSLVRNLALARLGGERR